MSKTETVSIIIPVFNGAPYLAEAIRSVLAQEACPLQLVVVDDGSTDGSHEIAAAFPAVELFRQDNQGAAAARNLGIQKARGEFLAFLDADDRWSPGKLALQLGEFQNDPTLDLVHGLVQQFISPELPENFSEKVQCPAEAMPGLVAGASLIRRAFFDRIGNFNPTLRIGEFVDWYSRAQRAGMKSLMLPEVVMHRRIHPNNTGLRDRIHRSDYLKVVRMALSRKQNEAQ